MLQWNWIPVYIEHVDQLIWRIVDSPRMSMERKVAAQQFERSVMELAQSYASITVAGNLNFLFFKSTPLKVFFHFDQVKVVS